MMELFLLLTEKKPNYWKSRVAFIPPINKIQLDFFNPKTTWNIRHSVFHRSGIFSIDQKVGSYCSFTLSKIQVIDIIENIYSDIWLFSICAEGSALSFCVVFNVVKYYQMKEIFWKHFRIWMVIFSKSFGMTDI